MNAKSAAAKPSPLGRGLSALFGDQDAAYQPPQGGSGGEPKTQMEKAIETMGEIGSDSAHSSSGVRQLSVAKMEPSRYQARRIFDEESMKELAASIRERGIIQPILVRAAGEGGLYEIVAGERRWRAAQMAGIHEVPVVVRAFSDREAMEIGLLENIQRKDLSVVEEAEGYKRLMEEFGYNQYDLARHLGKDRSRITHLLRILTLPQPVLEMLEGGEISMSVARMIVCVPDPLKLAKLAAERGLSMRQVEALARLEIEQGGKGGAAARKGANKPTKEVSSSDGGSISADVLSLERSISDVLGLKVDLRPGRKNSGSITLHYQSLDQLENITKRLM